jgi:hypothetical protein
MYSVNGYRRYSRDVDNAFNIIPSDRISMKGVDFPVIGVDEFGIIQFMQPEKEYQFPGNTVFEVPIKQAGGMTGMMKARLALDSHFGNPTARRMTNYDTRNYKFDDGSVGNVYVSSYDNLVTPHIQLDENNNLIYVDDVWSDNNKERSYQQSMKFEREEDAEYFGKNYKRVAPMKKLYQDGGYAQEEDPTTQLLYSIAEALQQGSDPREILNALKQNGVPEEQAMELIKYVMEQMQQQDQLQKEEKQQLEYAQDGKIVRKYNVEDLDWGKGINRAMLAFNMLQTPGLWQVPVKHSVLDALNAGLGLAAGLSGVGLGYSKLGAKKEYLGAKGLEPMKKLTISEIAQTPEITAKNMTYRPEISTIPLGTKGLEPMKKLTTSEVAQTPEITTKNMTSKPIEPTILSDSGMSFVVDYLPDSLKQRYKAHFGKQLSDFIDANSTDINTLRSLDLDEDLGTKQDGGYVQEEDPTTQLLYSIAEALQQGSDPREVLNALKQNGVPEEQAMELIKYVMEQMQQQDQLQKEEKQQLEYAQDGKIWNGNYGSYKQYLDNFAQQDFSQFSKQEQTNPEAFKITFNSMYPYLNLNNAESSSIKTKSKDPEDPEDNVKNEETKQTFYTGDPYGMLMANNALVGFQKFNDYLSDKDYEKEYNRRMMQIGNTNAKYNPVNYDNPYGTYTPNVGIGSNYGLVANGPIQDFGTGMFMAEEGGRLPQMPNGGRGIVTDKTVDPNRKKTVDVSNKKSNKISDNTSFLRNIAETVQNLEEPLIGKTYYFNGKPYLYNPEAREGRKFGFITSDPDNDIKQIDVDIVDFNKALNKDQIINNYYQKHYTLNELYNKSHNNPDDISKIKLERYYVSDNKENAKSYEDPDFYTFTGKDSEYKVPYKKLSRKSDLRHVNTKDEELYYLKNNMDRVIQKDGKLYYLYSSFLNDIPYVKKISRQSKVPEFFSYFYPAGDLRENYEAGFKSVPNVYAIPLDSNYEPIYDETKIFDENDLRNTRVAHNPFAKKEEEIVEEEIVKEEPTNTNKTTTTTQSSSKNNTSGKSTTQKKNDIMYNPKWERARF